MPRKPLLSKRNSSACDPGTLASLEAQYGVVQRDDAAATIAALRVLCAEPAMDAETRRLWPEAVGLALAGDAESLDDYVREVRRPAAGASIRDARRTHPTDALTPRAGAAKGSRTGREPVV